MDFEKLALKALIDGDLTLIPELRDDYFTKGNAKLYTKIIEFFSTHKRTPSYSELGAIITQKAPSSVAPQYLAIIQSLEAIKDATDSKLVLQSLKESFTLREVDKEMAELVEAQATKNTPEVKRLLNLLNERVNMNGLVVKNLADIREEEESQLVVRSFLDKASEDEYLGGGHTGLTIYSASSGGGKTICLAQAAINNFKAGLSTMIISLEMPRKVMYNRIISAQAGVDFSTINKNQCTPEEKKLCDEAHELLFNSGNDAKILIIDDDITDTELVNLIAVESQVNNIKCFVIDYLQLVEPSAWGDDWQGVTKLAKRLHKLTKAYDICILSASQVNEEGTEKGSIVPKVSARGSKEVLFSSSQFIHLAADKETEMLFMFQMKNRIAEKRHLILTPEFKYMRVESTGVELEV